MTNIFWDVSQKMLIMDTLALLRVLAICVLVVAAAADNSNSADVLLVKKEVAHPLEFCNFYLSAWVQPFNYT